MIKLENNETCFVQLWLRLERTRQLFGMQYRRFCIRRVMQSWLGCEAIDEMVWKVCNLATGHEDEPVYGLDILPAPSLHPRKSREFLRALVTVKLGIGIRKVDLKALDRAYSIAFPNSTPINVSKKRRVNRHNLRNEDDEEEEPQ
ncbi:MAG: hypothetical protein K6A67_10230 [Bacteroidales bacterium]|nr:hypothetical protein [Bacteroidales bacterium]